MFDIRINSQRRKFVLILRTLLTLSVPITPCVCYFELGLAQAVWRYIFYSLTLVTGCVRGWHPFKCCSRKCLPFNLMFQVNDLHADYLVGFLTNHHPCTRGWVAIVYGKPCCNRKLNLSSSLDSLFDPYFCPLDFGVEPEGVHSGSYLTDVLDAVI